MRSERADLLDRDGIAFRVIQRDGNQKDHGYDCDPHNRISQQHDLPIPLGFGPLEYYGAPDWLAHISMMHVFRICHDWNLHRAPSFRTCSIDALNALSGCALETRVPQE